METILIILIFLFIFLDEIFPGQKKQVSASEYVYFMSIYELTKGSR